jgi:nitroreductase
MNIYQTIQNRRSIRKFSQAPIPADVINRLLEAMRLAPSGKNAQPWKFIVVQDSITRQEIAEVCVFYTSSGREIRQDWIAEAPAIIIICGNPKTAFVKIIDDNRVIIANWDFLEEKQKSGPVQWESGILVDLTIPMDHLSLAAIEEGLGGCWVAGLDEVRLKEILGIPVDWRAPAVMPIGFPIENPEARRRKPLEEVVSFERYSE